MYDLINTRNQVRQFINKYLDSIMEGHDKAANEEILVNRSCHNKKTYVYYIYIYLQIVLEQKVAQGKPREEVYEALHINEFDCLFKGISKDPVEPELYIKAYPENWYCNAFYHKDSDYSTRKHYFPEHSVLAETIVYKVYRGNSLIDTISVHFLDSMSDFKLITINNKEYVLLNEWDYGYAMRAIQVQLLSKYSTAPVSFVENPVRYNREHCEEAMCIVVYWFPRYSECLKSKNTEDSNFNSYRPMYINYEAFLYPFANVGLAESAIEEAFTKPEPEQNQTLRQDSMYFYSRQFSAKGIDGISWENEVLYYTETQLDNYLDKMITAIKTLYLNILEEDRYLKGYNPEIVVKLMTPFWGYDSENCYNEFSAEGAWSDKVCHKLPDDSFDGECYFLNLNIDVNLTANSNLDS